VTEIPGKEHKVLISITTDVSMCLVPGTVGVLSSLSFFTRTCHRHFISYMES
jgi:hypothetical protein